jgi:hypothetical protein
MILTKEQLQEIAVMTKAHNDSIKKENAERLAIQEAEALKSKTEYEDKMKKMLEAEKKEEEIRKAQHEEMMSKMQEQITIEAEKQRKVFEDMVAKKVAEEFKRLSTLNK